MLQLGNASERSRIGRPEPGHFFRPGRAEGIAGAAPRDRRVC